MDVKAYIGSGVLEAFVLGSLTPAEAAEVQSMAARYPEVAAELRSIEEALSEYAAANAVQPPPALQDKIWAAIEAGRSTQAAPVRPAPATIPLSAAARSMPWAYAAAVVLLISSVIANIVLWQQGREARDDRSAMAIRMDSMHAEQQRLAAELGQYSRARDMMADTGMQTIVMHTMVTGHPMAATLYWSRAKGEAWVAMNALPVPPGGMQYQLWVIQDGKPVSMGMLPVNMANSPVMQKVPMQVTSGQAFAISLEKEGGNPVPTTVYVLGKV